MTYTTFNGWNIVPFPTTPAPAQITYTENDSVAVVQSFVSMQSQVQAWPGADYWQWQVSFPPMQRAAAQNWRTFFAQLRGKRNAFQMGDPLGRTPLGTGGGTPVVDSINLSMSTILNTRGWTPLLPAVLKPGDYLQIGYRLHMVAQNLDVNTDATGRAQIEIWPSIREAPADGDTIAINNTAGLFRLTDNAREWSVSVNKIYSFAFTAVEAR